MRKLIWPIPALVSLALVVVGCVNATGPVLLGGSGAGAAGAKGTLAVSYRPAGAGCDSCANNAPSGLTCGPDTYNARCAQNPPISVHVTFNNMVDSATALSKGIANCPTPDQYNRFKFVATTAYEHFVGTLGRNLKLTSSFRNEAVNAAVGGSSTSGHLLGEAMDMVIKDDATEAALTTALNGKYRSLTLKASQYALVDAYIKIMGNLPNGGLYHQIILETNKTGGTWIHYHCKNDGVTATAYPTNGKQTFVLFQSTGKTKTITVSADKTSVTIQ